MALRSAIRFPDLPPHNETRTKLALRRLDQANESRFNSLMRPLIDLQSDAVKDLPPEMREPIERYAESRSDEDLIRVIIACLNDLTSNGVSNDLPDETNFIDDLGLDSLAIAEFIFFFEDVFQIKISNEELVSLTTLGQMKQFLRTRLA